MTLATERVSPSKVASTARRSAINDTLPGDHIQHSTITRNNRIAVKARFPIFNKPSLKIVGGFRYNYEEFQFKTVPNEFSI